MNKVIITGNLTRDPELTQTPNGTTVCKFTAVSYTHLTLPTNSRV